MVFITCSSCDFVASYLLCPLQLPAGHFYSSPPGLFVKRYLFRHSTQSTFTSALASSETFIFEYLQVFPSCEVAVSQHPSASGIFLIYRPSTTHHFQKEEILFVSNSSCTEGKQYFRLGPPPPHLTHRMLQFGGNFYAEEADTNSSNYYQPLLYAGTTKPSMLLCQHISALA